MFEFLIVAGVAVFALACRTFVHPLLRKLGNLGVLAASFLAAYFLGGSSIAWGLVGAASWFFLPWLELLTRIRHLRLPLDKKLRHRHPPSADTFPLLREFTGEVEDEGFTYVEDSGWDWEETKQFVRVFYNPGERAQAAIYLNEQNNIAFAYLSVSSRGKDGKVWMTWNYPFAYAMKFSPDLQVNRVMNARSFMELLDCHHSFLLRNGLLNEDLREQNPEALQEDMEKDLRTQINHNLDQGLIRLSGQGTFRYSWRGLFYLWFQFLKDMVRLS